MSREAAGRRGVRRPADRDDGPVRGPGPSAPYPTERVRTYAMHDNPATPMLDTPATPMPELRHPAA